MIKITSLNKIYRSKKRRKCHALNDINLTLPDAGLVFVLGKSGSGKSTLLNLIGGLDNITSGSVEVDGNDLARFKEKDFCNYRNSHIGFIFQDYHLIDELTVYENIRLSLDLENRNEYHLIGEALARVDLAGYEERYPTELSGGEQQRVAIARAIVKKPRIILADEPTGNLDTNTARQIVELLKELSKDCLILIVSHNINDANNYADRIIELKKGRIISDKSRNPEFLDEVSLQNGELVYPQGLALSDNDIDFINNNLTKFKKKTDKFLPTAEPKSEARKVKILNKNLSLGRELNLSGKFLKSKTLAIAFSAFMVAVIMVIIAHAQTIIAFDGGEIVAGEMGKTNQDSILFNKIVSKELQERIDGNYRYAIGENDINSIYEAGYKGKIYPVYNISLPIMDYRNAAGIDIGYFHHGPYISETLGTIVADEELLSKKFGKLEYIAKAEQQHPSGIIITDYIADAILTYSTKHSGKTYEDILGIYYFNNWTIPSAYINGVIHTGYKDRYKELFEQIRNNKFSNISDMYENEDFKMLTNEIYEKLGYSYSINSDFAEEYKEWSSKRVLFKQVVLFNDIIDTFGKANQRYYMVWGKSGENILRDAWAYTIDAPEVPTGAKYIRVAFGKSDSTNPPEAGAPFNMFLMEHAHLVFSDGTSPTKEQLSFNKSSWLAPNGQAIITNSHPRSQVSDYIEIPDGTRISEFMTYTQRNNAFCAFYDESKQFISSVSVKNTGRVDLPEKSIIISCEEYYELFGTNYDSESINNFVPHTVKLSHYAFSDVERKDPLFEIEVNIVALNSGNTCWYLSSDVAELFADAQIYYNALYLDGTDGIGAALDAAEKLNFEPQSFAVEGIHTMTKAVDVFIPIFELIAIFLCVGVIFILVNFSSKMINDKMHEIGILKALGTKNSSIGAIFGLQVALIAILTCILATAGYYFFIDLANDVLIESLMRLAPGHVVLDLDFLTFQPKIALENCVLVGALALISLIFPMIKIKAIKPVKIIKAKD